jgi:type II secretory pathway predicted ATPase ExeA
MSLSKLKALYGLKWNPFHQDLPIQGLQYSPQIEQFCYKIEDLVIDGGFAAILGDPGQGKSCTLRLLNERLSGLQNIVIGEFIRPQSSVADFYRQLSEMFSIRYTGLNRFEGHQGLRKKWQTHIESSMFRPVLFIDEAQSLSRGVVEELKSLSSERFDSRMLITVILAGDMRLFQLLTSDPDFHPINSRLRHRLILQSRSISELEVFLKESMRLAGTPNLFTDGLVKALADNALGDLRSLLILANDVLQEAARSELRIIDEKLYLDVTKNPIMRKPRKR